ncbi:MAG TPA: terminase family protein [Kiritimatiellia bacterium]|nr:terminase family protein [Kiritimatiellia bacterium]
MAFVINYAAHPGQQSIHDARDRRFRVVCCGRRWGKTLSLAAELLDAGGQEGGTYGWIAPTYFIADRGVDALRDIAGDYVRIVGRNPVRAEFTGAAGDARILFLSADNPESILGLGFKGIVVDEAARIPADVWHYTIRPTLAQTMGWATLISTPNGRGWFYDLHTRGKDPRETDYQSFHFPSNSNPYFPAAEWEEAKRTMPADVFRQEYEAEFLEDSAGVFHNVDDCLLNTDPVRADDVVIGCDLAKHTDHTVLIAMDRKTGHCLDMERFNHLDWPIQKERIVNFYRKFNGLLVMDATGIGDPVYDDLRHVIPRIEPVKLTNMSKTQLIQRLVVAVEQRQVGWPAAWSVVTDELKRYEYAITPNGLITYNAPSGYHDDCVISMALANSARYQFKWTGDARLFSSIPHTCALRYSGRQLAY